MAVRAVNSCFIFRSAYSSPPHIPSLPALRCRRRCFHFCPLNSHINPKLGFSFSKSRSENGPVFGHHIRFVHSLVDIVMEELEAMRSRKRIRARSKLLICWCRMVVMSSKALVEDKLEKRVLQKGLLLEFRKDSERLLLAVAQKPDGKKNWMVSDQNGVTSSIKPQQITYIVPGVEDFDHTEIADFIQKAQSLLDPSLLEYAWMELLEKNKSVTAEELAEIIYGSMEPLESYSAHILLSKDEMYFSVIESKGSCSVYQPRPNVQVEELLRRKHAKEASEKELEEFVQLLKSAKSVPPHLKPPKCSWTTEEKIKNRVESLEAYAIDACKNDDQKKTAGMILKAMGLPKMSSAAVNLLVDIGYFPVHVNLDLLKFNVRTEYSDEVLLAAQNLLSISPDLDKTNRKDLTFLKVYAIDVDEADELDDALSAERLQDGQTRVWIHVADPTCLVQPQSIIEREAMRRGTSIFLPTATFPMFPEKLAMEALSLQQGKLCNAVSISVILHPDGSISEYTVCNSVIKPTYMLTYESASELLHLNLEEEAELKLLSEAAALRLQWRRQQGAIDTATMEARVKVTNPDDPEPSINLYVEDQSDPAMRLVSEMMVLCGEVIATFGSYNNIPLPYRGQPQSNISALAFSHLPEGPVRSSAYVKIMRAAEMDFRKPIRHGVLGVPGYVQFTSPIRRYMDLLAHYQVKAFLRGDSPPFSAGQLEGMSSLINLHVRVAKKLFNSSLRYWLLEFLRRQPKEKKFRALILRFIKDRMAALLLVEVGIQGPALVSVGKQVGDEIDVRVEEAHPRDDVLSLKEV
ncbi:ribonuclease II, chloroplastic/mitochondrial isoform X2 [Magnolia sinica]|uniref:ribonuclease II, chloroplastic/mitochondrial isoform X2 n=1 Tax=Magnolia sinica TaxID=86752 RepID=UPI002658EF22|nr:ribonuclease II, chloroplastic/mitochondrial isoform X2 [Magnolia sinica]